MSTREFYPRGAPFENILELAHTLGISTVLPRHNSPGEPAQSADSRYAWNGRNLLLDEYDELPTSCHELAHYCIAEPWQRSIPDYGLGRGPTSFRGRDKDTLDRAEWMFRLDDGHHGRVVEYQENLANMLTYFICVATEVPVEDWTRDAEGNNWRWATRARGQYVQESSDSRAVTWTYDHSRDHLYDPQEMRVFFTTYCELEYLGYVIDQKFTGKVNDHVPSPLHKPRTSYTR